MIASFFVDGVPRPQGSKRIVGRNLIDSNRDVLVPWRNHVAYVARTSLEGAWEATGEPVRVSLSFQMPRPAKHFDSRGNLRSGSPPLWHNHTPDLDKLVRAVLDGLTDGGAWDDDKHVVDLHAERRWASGGKPGVRVAMHHIVGAGAARNVEG